MPLINPRDVVWDHVPFDFRLSDQSRAWLRRNSWGDYSLDEDEDSAPLSASRFNTGKSPFVLSLRASYERLRASGSNSNDTV